MFKQLQQEWSQLKRYPAGQRFRQRYEARRREAKRPRPLTHWIGLVLAVVVLLAIGVALTVLPGPAIVFFFLAAALIARESRLMARFLDRVEMAARRLGDRLQRWWRRQSGAARLATALSVGLVSGVSVFLTYSLLNSAG